MSRPEPDPSVTAALPASATKLMPSASRQIDRPAAMWSANGVASLRAAAYLRGGEEAHADNLCCDFAYGWPALAGSTPVLRYLVPRAYNLLVPGLYWSHIARTRFFDRQIIETLEAGARQYVVLGAGLDSRSYRLLGDRTAAFEVDHPTAAGWKRQRVLHVLGGLPSHVRQVPADLRDPDSLTEKLLNAGWDATVPTAVLLEGVTMYLDTRSLRRIVREISGWAPGTRLMLDYFGPEVVGAAPTTWRVRRHCRGMAARGEPYTLGLTAAHAEALVTEEGLRPVAHHPPGTLATHVWPGADQRHLKTLSFHGLASFEVPLRTPSAT